MHATHSFACMGRSGTEDFMTGPIICKLFVEKVHV